MKNRLTLLAVLVLALGFGGCDLLSEQPSHAPITATGTVVLAGTGEPVAGLGVAIVGVTGGVPFARDQTVTDGDGRFSLRYDPPETVGAATAVGYYVRDNFPYDPSYVTRLNKGVAPGDRFDAGTVEVERATAP